MSVLDPPITEARTEELGVQKLSCRRDDFPRSIDGMGILSIIDRWSGPYIHTSMRRDTCSPMHAELPSIDGIKNVITWDQNGDSSPSLQMGMG